MGPLTGYDAAPSEGPERFSSSTHHFRQPATSFVK